MNSSQTSTSLLEQYSQLPTRLEVVIAGLNDVALDLHLQSGWSIREYVCHLVEGEQFWQINLRMVIGLNGAKFPFLWYLEHSQDEWAELWAYGRRSIKVLLAQYRADTQYLVDILKNLPSVWEHYGCITWPGDKEESCYSVRDIVEMHIAHLDGHSEDIHAIRDFHGR